MKDGDRATDTDCWLRNLMNESHAPRGKIHHSALKGQMTSPDPVPKRFWSHELSGRLLSEAKDIQAEGDSHCARRNATLISQNRVVPAKFRFIGVAAASVSVLRQPNDITAADVIFTPNQVDEAHADFVALRASDADIPALLDWLQDNLKFIPSGSLSDVRASISIVQEPAVSTTGGSIET